MANIASARKRARQAVQLNAHNSSLRSRLRTAIKKVSSDLLQAGMPCWAFRCSSRTTI